MSFFLPAFRFSSFIRGYKVKGPVRLPRLPLAYRKSLKEFAEPGGEAEEKHIGARENRAPPSPIPSQPASLPRLVLVQSAIHL
ncbi:hypothetical protein G6O67_006213 [Ophiocordyceps sinensis]|uniref:Uncharacterized protein n=1 Tax=Ophiocordyceps sinensis TaxID=72228 RepID=A0A8H4PMS5_9HYPO|nr:hypothetical protein G6O67_006213 [Ophiocordyceps sinensis]